MNDMAQLNLREPAQVDWANYNSGGGYQAPPPALGPDGKYIIYYGVVESAVERPGRFAVDEEGNPYLNFLLDPIKIVNSGKHDGYTIRFAEASVKPFEKAGKPIKGNPNALANFLRACGSQGKPQTNDQYRAAVKACQGKRFPFTITWEAYNKDTGERIKGFSSFPDDQERPGEKKAILKAGDIYTVRDYKGAILDTKVVESEVLFANAKLRFFADPTRSK